MEFTLVYWDTKLKAAQGDAPALGKNITYDASVPGRSSSVRL